MKKSFILSLLMGLLSSCYQNNLKEEALVLDRQGAMPRVHSKVRILPVELGDFPISITTNGKLKARQRTEIKSETTGRVVKIIAREGMFFKKGECLIVFDDQLQQMQWQQSQLALEEASIEKADLLIRHGGRAFEDSSVTPSKLEYINTRSGYKKAQLGIKKAAFELEKTNIYAPFNGVIANVRGKMDQQVTPGEILCTLINPESLEVIFSLLEEQALNVQKGQPIKVRTMTTADWLKGRVVAINPVVNDQGLVQLFAQLNPAQQRLWEGMNVEVVLQQNIPEQLIIPKSAIVSRAGRPVVFTYESSRQLAKWNFVSLAYENDLAVAVRKGLNPMDTIIYEGNLNLEHEVAVEIH